MRPPSSSLEAAMMCQLTGMVAEVGASAACWEK